MEARFEAFVETVSRAVGHADRVGPFRKYCTGLLLPIERKSVEPMAARLAPERVRSEHQSLHHFVADAAWSDEAVLAASRAFAFPSLLRRGPVRAWIVDDTGIPKKGTHSVGVARQYCGVLGKQENCQVAVSLSVAGETWSLPVAFRLYLPESWSEDADRRSKVGIPAELRFQSKLEIALGQIQEAIAGGLPSGVVLADAGYGNSSEFRANLTELGLEYAVGVQSTTTVWTEGSGPLPPRRWKGIGRPPSRPRRTSTNQPVSVRDLASSLRFRPVTWREGTARKLRSRFARCRIRVAHHDRAVSPEWLLVEWPEGETEPTKYWLSSLPEKASLRTLVATAKLRWRIERDYQELKDELGIDQYEGRGWRGFHHHATLCIAAYAFLAAERGRFPPSGRSRLPFRLPRVPRSFKPRGSPAAP